MRHSFKTTIEIALPEVKISKDAPLKEWAPIVKNEDEWEAVIDSFFNNARKMRENEIMRDNEILDAETLR